MLFVVASAILFTWGLCALVLAGLGALALRPIAGASSGRFSPTSAFWTGLALAVAFLETWSLFLRVSLETSLVLAAFGVSGIIWQRALIFRQFREAVRGRAAMLAVFSLIVVYVALRSAGPCTHFDTGLYGEPSIHWIISYPAVPGLANVHGRLGFNSAVFLCIAALGQGFWNGLGFHLFTGMILAAMWTAVLPAWQKILRHSPENRARAADWFHAILVIPAAMWSAREQIAGAPTDVPANAVCLIAAGILFTQLERGRESMDGSDRRQSNIELVVAAMLLALAVSFKLSTLVFAALGWVICAVCLLAGNREACNRLKWLAGAVLLPAAILLPWLARNLILTGYPFFPAAVLGIPADWRVPKAAADLMVSWVHSWGRNPDARVAETQGWSWFAPWLLRTIRMREQFQIPLLLSLGGIAAALAARVRAAPSERRRWLWLLAPSVAGVAFWFIESPDTRFGAAAIWTTGATLGALGIVNLMAISKRPPARIFAAGILIAAAWCLFSFDWQESYRPFLKVRGFISLPEARVVPRRTLSGLVVYVPSSGYQCWDAPLPCTPYFDPTLRLRKPEELRDGFRAEGREELPPY
ncbi:MAG TPA: hypothetical protein VGT03_01230 [Candidatus Acidoferrales bacterium]|nr:hypothetical protein [Candidatus Acidoferrales bacterium]